MEFGFYGFDPDSTGELAAGFQGGEGRSYVSSVEIVNHLLINVITCR